MREISVRIFDDLDYNRNQSRNEAVVTVTIGLDGVWRELDLTRENEEIVRATIRPLMRAGHDLEGASAAELPNRRPYTKPDHGRVKFLRGLRQWCHDTGQRNSSGSGWAYQTNDTLKYYYGTRLIARYQAYLNEQATAQRVRLPDGTAPEHAENGRNP